MQISVDNSVLQTQIFILFFALTLLFSLRKKRPLEFDNSLSEELKGFAMLAIIFSHIGYFLVSGQKFLYPLSVVAGVGVNIFLFLSGYGLALSSVSKPLSLKDFYFKRLLKLFLPLWLLLTIFLLLDFFWLGKVYSVDYLAQSFGGIYLSSNPRFDIDSPLWYFSLVFFFYLIFPLIFRPKRPLLSGFIILLNSWLLLHIPLPLHADNIYLYKLHFLAFPLGVIAAAIKFRFHYFNNLVIRTIVLTILCLVFGYLAINSGVGEGMVKEQAISIISALLVIVIFLLKNFQFRFFNLVGRYSYEIYLLHWPILARYEHFFKFLPGSLALVFYLMEFIILSMLVQKFANKLLDLRKSNP